MKKGSHKHNWNKANSRLDAIKRQCNKYKTNVDLKRLAYDDKHRFILCSLPKVYFKNSNTYFKRFIEI